ncbi:hypothetical protein BKA62DRAFT_643404 [Auriculariales sp. MPI-PUGE-AT-0066]|nr:hypothetical protein BKA62DRAFT_643404 [Auriculariales sp. MPI-PUGE-AT-0066]
MNAHSNPIPSPYEARLSEQQVIDGFHVFLSSALGQAKAERLLDDDTLASAQADVVIGGPALCLFFGALRSVTEPPSVPIPQTAPSANGLPTKSGAPPLILSQASCPEQFLPFMRVWSSTVPKIQALAPEYQHDLARILCERPPLQSNLPPEIMGIAADLRAVAIEIGQRRSFQERYSSDLQAALDSGAPTSATSASSPSRIRANFVPPPSYEASSDAGTSPAGSHRSLPPSPIPPALPLHPDPLPHRHRPHELPLSIATSSSHQPVEYSPSLLSPTQPLQPRRPSRRTPSPIPMPVAGSSHRRTPSAASSNGGTSSPASPNLLPNTDPPVVFIRETLYSAIADVLSNAPRIRAMLKRDRTRAYFAAVGLAVLQVSLECITPSGGVRGILNRELTLAMCPPHYRPLMFELASIGRDARSADEEDTQRALKLLERGQDDKIGTPRMDRVRRVLELGVGYEDAQREAATESEVSDTEAEYTGRRSVEGRAVQMANRINALALRMTLLPEFQQRQEQVFKVLESVY